MTIRDTLKRNLIYIIIIIGMGVCFINRWQLWIQLWHRMIQRYGMMSVQELQARHGHLM